MSMGDTLTWEGSVPEFGAKRAGVRKHILRYKVRFLVGFRNTSTKTEHLRIEVESSWSDECVAKAMLDEWEEKSRPYCLKRYGTKLKFTTIPNNAVVVHAFKSTKHSNGKVVPAYPSKLEVLSKLNVSVELID